LSPLNVSLRTSCDMAGATEGVHVGWKEVQNRGGNADATDLASGGKVADMRPQRWGRKVKLPHKQKIQHGVKVGGRGMWANGEKKTRGAARGEGGEEKTEGVNKRSWGNEQGAPRLPGISTP